MFFRFYQRFTGIVLSNDVLRLFNLLSDSTIALESKNTRKIDLRRIFQKNFEKIVTFSALTYSNMVNRSK